MMAKTVQGSKRSWQVLDLIGSGDAGEVLRVRSQDGLSQGVMKRPLQNASGGTILRQAMQIEREGRTLLTLDGIDKKRNGLLIHSPILLDQSPHGSSQTSTLFIISEDVSGTAISSLLKGLHQGGPPLSQVLVVRVLNGLLQLLREAHAHGVLWNDVKMDHIFWDAAEKKLSFIDWGNSLRIGDASATNEKASSLLDYQQLLSEGRILMEQTAPELLLELGWPVSVNDLDENELNSLRFRTEYLESYLGMRVVEYQVLLRKYLAKVSDHQTLLELLKLMQALAQLGISVDQGAILEAATNLIVELITLSGYAQSSDVSKLILEYFAQSAGSNWQLGDYALKLDALKDHPLRKELLSAIFSANWVEAVWTLQRIQDSPENKLDLSPLQQALHQAGLSTSTQAGSVHSLVLKLAGELRFWIENTGSMAPTDPELLDFLNNSLKELGTLEADWSILQEDEVLGQSLLELRTWADQNLPAALPGLPALKLALTQLLARFRDLHRTWQEGDLKGLQRKLKEIFSAEPGLVYLPRIAAWVQELEVWIESFKTGPQAGETVTQFATNLIGRFPPGAIHFGTSDWLQGYWSTAHFIQNGLDIQTLRQQAETEAWPTPWLHLPNAALDLPIDLARQTSLTPDQQDSADQLLKALRTSSDPSKQLADLRKSMPAFFPLYRELGDALSHAFDAIEHPKVSFTAEAFPESQRKAVSEALEVLGDISDWKEAQRNGRLIETSSSSDLAKRWKVLEELQNAGKTWQSNDLPILTAIYQKNWEQLPDPESTIAKDPLTQSALSISRLAFTWGKVPEQGLFKAQVNDMLAEADAAQETFLKFWQEAESSQNAAYAWLIRTHQAFLSGLNNYLLTLSRQLRTVLRAMDVVNTPQMARSRLAHISAGDLIFASVQLDDLLRPASRKRSAVRQWQQQYLDLLKENDRETILRSIQAIESIHPLLPWFDELVRRDAGYFEAHDQPRW